MAITKVVMPKLSDAMETGKLLKWLKKEGDRVEGGEIVAEIETDKADIELEAFGSGVLRKVLVAPGTDVPVGATIAVIADPNEDISVAVGPSETKSPPPAAKVEPARATTPAPVTPSPARHLGAEVEAEEEEIVEAPGGRVRASPLARKLARESGVELTLIKGSGPGGRIVRRDIETHLEKKAAPSPAPVRPAARVAAGPEVEERPLSSIRKTIARRMAESKATAPHFYLTVEVRMDRVWELREQLNQLEGQPKVSVTDLILKASALALQAHPEVNASFAGETVRVHQRVHLGIAVALDEGLITPVLRECDAKSLAEIAADARDLTERARARKLKVQEITGGTFTVSNLGMYDIEEFSAIINPPEGAILAVGKVLEKPVVEDGRIGIGRRLRLTLSCDHRVMDGVMGARFLQTLARSLEEPLRLLV